MDTYIPVTVAAQLSHISEGDLIQLSRVGKIRSVMTITGETLVNEKDVTPLPSREDFNHLAGKAIGLRQAEARYGVNNKTISRWIDRGLIRVLQHGERGQRTLVDEQDIAYMAAKYKRDPGRGKRTAM